MAIAINIKNLIEDNIVENVRIEYKKGFNPQTILPSICAFANDIDNFAGGYIVIGVEEDNGKAKLPPVGIETSKIDEIEKEIVRFCKKCLTPNYIPVIDHQRYKGKNLIILWCYAAEERPYKCYKDVFEEKSKTKYITYIRKGSTSIVASTSDERELYSLSSKAPFDDRCNYNVSIDDLDKSLVIEYLKETKSNLYKNANNISLEELLEDLRVLSGPKESLHPRNIAVLMFARNPDKYIPYSYIEYTQIDDPTGNGMIEKTFKGSLYQQYIDAMNYIKNNLIKKKTYKISNDFKAKVIYNYPYGAIEEILANAILHKSYQENEPVSIRVESDHIEITSVPGFDRTISDSQIKTLNPRSKRYLNRRIAEFLKELRIVEAKNTGYPEIVSMCKANGSPMPIIDMNIERDYVTVILPIHEDFNETKKSLEEKILDALAIKPMKKTELCNYLGYQRIVNSVSKKLESLIDKNMVEVVKKEYKLK